MIYFLFQYQRFNGLLKKYIFCFLINFVNNLSSCLVAISDYRSSRAISLRPERSLSQGFTSLELDTVVEERCSDVEQTQTEILQPESPMESTTASYKMSISSSQQKPDNTKNTTAVTCTSKSQELMVPTAPLAIASTTKSPHLSLITKSKSADNPHKNKSKYLQTHTEYPMSTLSPRNFTLKRQKRIGENRPLTRKTKTSSPSGSSSVTMRKSKSLDAEHSYSLASIQSPLWVTLTNARTIEELSREQI